MLVSNLYFWWKLIHWAFGFCSIKELWSSLPKATKINETLPFLEEQFTDFKVNSLSHHLSQLTVLLLSSVILNFESAKKNLVSFLDTLNVWRNSRNAEVKAKRALAKGPWFIANKSQIQRNNSCNIHHCYTFSTNIQVISFV